ncbi:3-dehydroquinate synthase [Corynebacterium canis]|uniref:3-dehydroquinate synthase n=1 Tax=Corynebacterium canis TaxID=679663 RepID=A0A5C5UEG9_9CORY|nr:3-dehydroquinate synthase [Corynebacterium canis]TWT24033.1 3-dehydroquinate synthase [Corynebacterium canis]WJY75398.1 3-dehydroquinate synthase [Corynebacterium canis]
MTVISVTGASPYDVTIAHGVTPQIVAAVRADCTNVLIIHQEPLMAAAENLAAALRARGLKVFAAEVPDAEAGKTLAVAGELWDRCGELGLGRRDVIIGLGGGAVTDLAGFVAACWMRGIDVIQVPTTLLAMVDAAVGGKTGINTDAGKNLVGAFHEPAAVCIDLDFLRTLPVEELIAGSAEIIKTGFIADPVILDLYESDPAACLRVDGYLPELIARSVAVKARVVAADLQESGLREILNYGHTFGHSVELREAFRWRHGNAVAVGMMFIAELAEIHGLIDAALVDRHRNILRSIGLPVSYESGCFDELLVGMGRDKKNREGKLRFVALTGPGDTTRLVDPSVETLREAYERIS